MKVEFKDGFVIITAPVAPRTSKSGKTTLLASSSGKVGVDYEGKPVTVGLNVYVPKS